MQVFIVFLITGFFLGAWGAERPQITIGVRVKGRPTFNYGKAAEWHSLPSSKGVTVDLSRFVVKNQRQEWG